MDMALGPSCEHLDRSKSSINYCVAVAVYAERFDSHYEGILGLRLFWWVLLVLEKTWADVLFG